MSDYILRQLQEGISQRQEELHKVADLLANNAKRINSYWVMSRIGLISLGALAATKGAFDKFSPADSIFNLIFFTLIGLFVAIITGLETTFKYESKCAELKILAAECHSTLRQIDTQWYLKVGFDQSIDDKAANALALMEIQDSKLGDIQTRATKLGLNLTLEIRQLIDPNQQFYTA